MYKYWIYIKTTRLALESFLELQVDSNRQRQPRTLQLEVNSKNLQKYIYALYFRCLAPVRLAPSDCAGACVDLAEPVVVVDTVDCDCDAGTGGFGEDLCSRPMIKDAMVPDPKTSNHRGINRVTL